MNLALKEIESDGGPCLVLCVAETGEVIPGQVSVSVEATVSISGPGNSVTTCEIILAGLPIFKG